MDVAVLIIAVILIPFLFLFVSKQAEKVRSNYTQLAEKYSGVVEPGSWSKHPTVRFDYGNSPVVIDVYSTGGEDSTEYAQARFQLPHPMARFELYPENFMTRLGKNLLGMTDVQIGSPAFDDAYVIKGANRPALRDLLTSHVQHNINELRKLLPNDDIYVSINGRELVVRKLSTINSFAELSRFTELAIQLFDSLPSTEGIEFPIDAPDVNLEDAVCQVCGESIKDEIVFCRSCETPHHRECWRYYGACSTYGCLQKLFMRPNSKRAKLLQRG